MYKHLNLCLFSDVVFFFLPRQAMSRCATTGRGSAIDSLATLISLPLVPLRELLSVVEMQEVCALERASAASLVVRTYHTY